MASFIISGSFTNLAIESRSLVSIPLALRYSWIAWLYSIPPETAPTPKNWPTICGIAAAPLSANPIPKVANIAVVATADLPSISPPKSPFWAGERSSEKADQPSENPS